MKHPRVTVILATYNRARLIDDAIRSVRAQTYGDWELVIADDGSADRTPEVVAVWRKKEPRIRYTRSMVNQGISKNYNRGFYVARGEYIAMIDDDDPWCDTEKLAKQVALLDAHPNVVGCGGGVIVKNTEGNEMYRYLKPLADVDIRRYMLFSNPMANSTTLFRARAAEDVGWYDETTRYSGDRDFWLKMGRIGNLMNTPEYYSYYTMSGANTSISKIRPHLRASLSIMKRYRNDYPGFHAALAVNYAQYAYAFLPQRLRGISHKTLAIFKKRVLG